MVDIAVGVFLGMVAFSLLNALLAVPSKLHQIRMERKFKREMQEVADHLFNMAVEAKKEIENAERAKANQSGEGRKATPRSGSKKAGSGAKNRSGSSVKNSQVRSRVEKQSPKTSNKS